MLGVAHDATPKQIRDAFRSLALQYHPDRNKAPEAQEKFKEIAAACAVLSDPAKRRDYDERGFAGVAGIFDQDLFRGMDFGDLFGGLNFDFGGLHGAIGKGLFDGFFGRRRAGPPQGENIEVELRVPLARVASGGEEKLRYGRAAPCAACQGSGAKAGTTPRSCPECQGSGRKVESSRRREGKGQVRVQHITVCPACSGVGHFIDQPCPECGGKGWQKHEETLTVNVPVGVHEGTALRVPGHGGPARAPGGVPGDLFVIVRTLPDARFERAGEDLWRIETLSIPQAVLGTTRRVPTLDAEVDVTIPPGTQPDTVLRLPERGLPEFGAPRRGALYLRLAVPERLNPRERELYEQLRELESAPAARVQ